MKIATNYVHRAADTAFISAKQAKTKVAWIAAIDKAEEAKDAYDAVIQKAQQRITELSSVPSSATSQQEKEVMTGAIQAAQAQKEHWERKYRLAKAQAIFTPSHSVTNYAARVISDVALYQKQVAPEVAVDPTKISWEVQGVRLPKILGVSKTIIANIKIGYSPFVAAVNAYMENPDANFSAVCALVEVAHKTVSNRYRGDVVGDGNDALCDALSDFCAVTDCAHAIVNDRKPPEPWMSYNDFAGRAKSAASAATKALGTPWEEEARWFADAAQRVADFVKVIKKK